MDSETLARNLLEAGLLGMDEKDRFESDAGPRILSHDD
jgi:hypothetical protein